MVGCFEKVFWNLIEKPRRGCRIRFSHAHPGSRHAHCEKLLSTCDSDVEKTPLFLQSRLHHAFFMRQNAIFKSHEKASRKLESFSAMKGHEMNFVINCLFRRGVDLSIESCVCDEIL